MTKKFNGKKCKNEQNLFERFNCNSTISKGN